jgi:uncharacterized protein (TIGR03437 family)
LVITLTSNLLAQLPTAAPAISAVVPSFMGKAGFTSNSYLEIYGTNLAQTQRAWSVADFNGRVGPTSLDNVRVTVNGRSAVVQYVSPGQININTPDDAAVGPVAIVVENSGRSSAPFNLVRSRIAPTLHTSSDFSIGGRQYVMARTPDFRNFVGRPGMAPLYTFVPGRPGDTIVLYALGCGPTSPATQAGTLAAQNSPVALPLTVRIGGVAATITFGGIVAGTIGLYQLNVVIPQVGDGDRSIELIVDGISNAQNLYLPLGSSSQPPITPRHVTTIGWSFSHPTSWAATENRINPQVVEVVLRRASSPGQLMAVTMGRVPVCNEQEYANLFDQDVRPQDFLNWKTPNPFYWWFGVGLGYVKTYESLDGRRVRSIVAVCGRDEYAGHLIVGFVQSEPAAQETLDAFDILMNTLGLNGGPPAPKLTGAWNSSTEAGWTLRFNANGTVDSSGGRSEFACSGQYRHAGDNLDLSWRCNAPPPLSGPCSVRLGYSTMILSCGRNDFQFRRQIF